MALRKVAPTLFRRADDEAAFERLYERHVEGVYRYSLAMLGDAADAEDVTQTTFLNAYRAFKSGTRPEKPSSWLIAIAHNVCRQRFRQAQRRPREVAFDEGIGDAEVLEPSGPTADELRRALSQLPPNQRAALVMRELEGSSYAEISDVLGVSVSALETLLFRARRSLREQLEEQISCQEASLAINRQLDGRLSLGERRALRAHLRACSDCHSFAQSQRAQRRALKSLALVPLPLTIAHWSGAQSVSAATGAGGLAAVGATTGGAGAGASSIALGGLAAKAAAVVAAGVVVGGGAYEGVKHSPLSNAPPKAKAAIAAGKHGGLPIASARTFETPKVAAPVATRVHTVPLRKLRATGVGNVPPKNAKSGKAAAAHKAHVPPGRKVKATAHTNPHSLGDNPPGKEVSAAHSQAGSRGPKSATHSQAPEHSQAATAKSKQPKAKAQAPAHTQSPEHSQSATHKATPPKKTTTTETTTTPTETTPTETTESRGRSGKTPSPPAPDDSTSAPRGNP